MDLIALAVAFLVESASAFRLRNAVVCLNTTFVFSGLLLFYDLEEKLWLPCDDEKEKS